MDAMRAALAGTIERLRHQKEQTLSHSRRIGYRMGHVWAGGFGNNDTILAIADDAFGRGRTVRDAMWDLDRDLVTSKEAAVNNRRVTDRRLRYGLRYDGKAREAFWEGFIEGVTALWKQETA